MKFTDFEASTTHLFKIQAIFLEADDPSLLLLSATFQVAFRAWNLLELLILRRKWIGEIFAIQLAKILAEWRALATLINRLFSDLRCQISGGHSSTESSLENWLWFSTSPYSGLKSVSSLPFDSWLSSPQFSAAWFSFHPSFVVQNSIVFQTVFSSFDKFLPSGRRLHWILFWVREFMAPRCCKACCRQPCPFSSSFSF